MKVVLVDPNCKDNRWRFKSCLRETSKGMKNEIKSLDFTNCPLEFHNTHVRKSFDQCGLFLEEAGGSKHEKVLETSEDYQVSQHANQERKLIFQDEFSSGSYDLSRSNKSKLCSKTATKKLSEQTTYRPPSTPRTALTVLDFRCSKKVTKTRTVSFQFRNTTGAVDKPLGGVAGACEHVPVNLYAKNNSGEARSVSPSNHQSFKPTVSFTSEWKLKVPKGKVRSDLSSLTCTFRVKNKNRKFGKDAR